MNRSCKIASEKVLDNYAVARFGERPSKKYDKRMIRKYRRTVEKRLLKERD